MRNVVDYGGFRGFHFNDNIHFELLRFVDDNVIICDGSWSNLWCIKVILRGFKLTTSLCINLNKTKLFGIHVEDYIMIVASTFLACDIGRFPFLFLGIPVEAKHRRKDTW